MTHFSFGYITALTAVGKKDTDNHGYLFMCPFFMCQWGKLFLSHFQSFVEFYFFVRSKKKKKEQKSSMLFIWVLYNHLLVESFYCFI